MYAQFVVLLIVYSCPPPFFILGSSSLKDKGYLQWSLICYKHFWSFYLLYLVTEMLIFRWTNLSVLFYMLVSSFLNKIAVAIEGGFVRVYIDFLSIGIHIFLTL